MDTHMYTNLTSTQRGYTFLLTHIHRKKTRIKCRAIHTHVIQSLCAICVCVCVVVCLPHNTHSSTQAHRKQHYKLCDNEPTHIHTRTHLHLRQQQTTTTGANCLAAAAAVVAAGRSSNRMAVDVWKNWWCWLDRQAGHRLVAPNWETARSTERQLRRRRRSSSQNIYM